MRLLYRLCNKVVALIFCLLINSFCIVQAEPGFGDNVDAFCVGKPGFENPPVFGGLILENCAKCHNPANKNLDQTPAFDLYKKAKGGDYSALCDYISPPIPMCTDADLDGFYMEPNCGTPVDCNDNDAMINPLADEICTDGKDNNCNGLVDSADLAVQNCPIPNACTDMDKDSFSIEGGTCGPIDCNDNNAMIYPGAVELCADKIDNNCSGKVDLADPAVDKNTCPVECIDEDKDGYSITGGEYCGPIDCNDADAFVNPGVAEVCSDNIDNNCNGTVDTADQYCPAMDPKAKLKELKDQIKQHKRDCKTKEKQLKKEYEALKKQMEQAKEREDDEDDEDED